MWNTVQRVTWNHGRTGVPGAVWQQCYLLRHRADFRLYTDASLASTEPLLSTYFCLADCLLPISDNEAFRKTKNSIVCIHSHVSKSAWIIQNLQLVLGLPWGLCSIGFAWYSFGRSQPGGILVRCAIHFNRLNNLVKQQLYFKALLDCRAPHIVTESKTSNAAEKHHFRCP